MVVPTLRSVGPSCCSKPDGRRSRTAEDSDVDSGSPRIGECYG